MTTLADEYVRFLLCGDDQHISTETLREFELKLSNTLASGMTDAQIARVVCRLVNRIMKPETMTTETTLLDMLKKVTAAALYVNDTNLRMADFRGARVSLTLLAEASALIAKAANETAGKPRSE